MPSIRLCLLLLCAVFSGYASAEVLRVYNWQDYMDADVLQAFEQQYGVTVEQLFFNDEAERDASVKQLKPDVVMLSSDYLPAYIDKNWIVPLDETQAANLQHIERRWLRRYNNKLYAMPYTWGSLGIAYRRDLLATEVVYWQDIFNLSGDNFKHRLYMLSGANEVVGIALKALGFGLDNTEPHVMEKVTEVLLHQKPYVKAYGVPDLDTNHPLVSGDAWIAMMYSGDALTLKELHPDIAYVTPQEGTLLFVDQFAIMADSPRQDLALRFVNFLQIPENAARTALTLNYATPNRGALALLPEAHLRNPDIYPPVEVMMKSEFLPPSKLLYQSVFEQVISE